MSIEAASAFRQMANTNSELKAALWKCKEWEQTIELAGEHGFEFSSDEALQVIGRAKDAGDLSGFERAMHGPYTAGASIESELSDDDLELVSGGAPICCNCGNVST